MTSCQISLTATLLGIAYLSNASAEMNCLTDAKSSNSGHSGHLIWSQGTSGIWDSIAWVRQEVQVVVSRPQDGVILCLRKLAVPSDSMQTTHSVAPKVLVCETVLLRATIGTSSSESSVGDWRRSSEFPSRKVLKRWASFGYWFIHPWTRFFALLDVEVMFQGWQDVKEAHPWSSFWNDVDCSASIFGKSGPFRSESTCDQKLSSGIPNNLVPWFVLQVKVRVNLKMKGSDDLERQYMMEGMFEMDILTNRKEGCWSCSLIQMTSCDDLMM